jgi:hypothetical protein
MRHPSIPKFTRYLAGVVSLCAGDHGQHVFGPHCHHHRRNCSSSAGLEKVGALLDTDIDYFFHNLGHDPTMVRPYVMTVYDGNIARAMLVGRVRNRIHDRLDALAKLWREYRFSRTKSREQWLRSYRQLS